MFYFILALLLIYLIIRYFMPYLLPRVLMFWFRQFQKAANRQQRGNQKNGSIRIKYDPTSTAKRKIPETEGEYVDYEDINNK